MARNLTTIGATLVTMFAVACADAVVLFDVPFSAPEHTLGSPPATGIGSAGPSAIVFVQPLVENSTLLTGQALEFDTTGNGGFAPRLEQIEFDLGVGASAYSVSFDIVIDSLTDLGDNFVILFDTPVIQNLEFQGDGDIFLFQPGVGNSIIGSLSIGTAFNVLVDVDLLAAEWSIFIDSLLLHQGAFASTSGDVESVRFSINDVDPLTANSQDTDSDSVVRVDNIRITASVPEPTTLALLSLGLVGAGFARRQSA